MNTLHGLLEEALERTPFGTAHACWTDTLISLDRAAEAASSLEDWLPDSRGVGRCELLCALARARAATGLSADKLLSEACALAEAEWCDAERAWSALAASHEALGATGAALEAWVHSDNPYRFDCCDAVSATAVSLRRGGQWAGLERLLRHVGPGHDQALILDRVIDDARAEPAIGPALQALWWIPEPLREDALLRAVAGAVEDGAAEDGWAVEALWDGIEGGSASRALARAMLGDDSGARELLAPLLVASLGSARDIGAEDGRHAATALAWMGDVEGAAWCLRRIRDMRAALRALESAAAVVRQPGLLLEQALERWPEEVTVARVVGVLEVGLAGSDAQQAAAGRARLRAAAERAGVLEDFYLRRLALQELAHAQIRVGDVDGGLETAERLSRQRFGHEHIVAAAVRLAAAGGEASALVARLPPGEARVRVCCQVLCLRGDLLEGRPQMRENIAR